MPGPLTALTFPTPADLLAAGWNAWWRDHKLPPSPVQILESARAAFWIWRDDLMQEHSHYLATRLGDTCTCLAGNRRCKCRLLPLFDLVADLVEDRIDCRAWEFPDPDEEEKEFITTWIAWGLTCLRWTLLYEDRAQVDVTYAEASTFMLNPPPRPAITPPAPRPAAPRPSRTTVWPQPALF